MGRRYIQKGGLTGRTTGKGIKGRKVRENGSQWECGGMTVDTRVLRGSVQSGHRGQVSRRPYKDHEQRRVRHVVCESLLSYLQGANERLPSLAQRETILPVRSFLMK